jgi:nitroreductase
MSNTIDTINHIIKSRRSIFPASYIEKEIPKEVIEAIVANANYAPTHKLTEPWRFTIFRKEGLDKLGKELAGLYKQHTSEEKFMQNKYDSMHSKVIKSSCVIAINMKVHHDKLPEWEELAATACAVENMWLTATAYNVGAYWSTPGTIKHLNHFLGLADDEKCIGLFYMGYHTDEPREANRTPIEEKVKWVEA